MKGVKLDLNIVGKAYNTSFMFFKNDTIKNIFCDTAISYMIQASRQNLCPIFNRNKSLYMIFAEQQLFGEVAANNNVNVKTLVKEKMLAGLNGFIEHTKENGIMKERYAHLFLVHLGEHKNKLKNIDVQESVRNQINDLYLERKIDYNSEINR